MMALVGARRFSLAAGLLALSLLAIGGLALLHRSHAAPGTSGPPASLDRPPATNTAALDSSLRAIEDGAREAPRDRWDPEYVVAQVGRDPAGLFRWVQENTRWIPYRGLLRGATGVLLDREGNSLDRAVLLGTLLARAGQTVRLAHGDLGRDQAAKLLPALAASRRIPAAPEAGPAPPSKADLRAVAAKYRLDGPAVERTLERQRAALERLTDTLDQRATTQAARLLAALGHPDSATDWRERYDSAVSALQDHWWIQRQEGAGWVDLDLLAPIDSSGQALGVPRETLAIGDVPDSLYHSIVIRVVAERWTGAGPGEETVLERTVRPSESIGQPIVLQFWPGDWPSDVILATADRLNSFRTAALQQQRWRVALLAGGSATQATLLASGARETGGSSALGGLGRGIGQGPQGSGGASDGSSRGTVTAVWLEYEMRAPGAAAHPIRRAVFDLIGPAARQTKVPPPALTDTQRLERSLALMMRTEILPLPARLAPEFVGWLATQSLLANRRLLHAAAAGDLAPGTPGSDSVFASSAPPAGPLAGLALARFTLSPVADQIFVGHAGLLTRHQGPEISGNGIATLDAIDIVANDVDVDLTAPDGFAVRLAQGVFETNAEAVLPVLRGRVENAGLAYAGSEDWAVLSPVRADEASRLDLPADVRARIRHELDAGYLVVASRKAGGPNGPGYAAWWRIDPATGTTIGFGDRGWGQMVDRAMLTDLAVYMAENFAFEYALCQAIPQVANDLRFVGNVIEEQGWGPSWTKPAPQAVDPLELAKANNRVCVIQAIKMGFVATLPLVILTIRYTSGGRVVWNPALRRFVYNEIGGIKIPPKLVKGPVGGGAGGPHGSPTLPTIHVPEGAGTSPKGYPGPGGGGAPAGGTEPPADPLGHTNPDLGKTQPDLSKTQPDLSKTQPDLSKTQPDLGKTQPDLPRTEFDPAARPDAAAEPKDPSPALTPEEARENLRQAHAEYTDAAQESFEATRDFVQYRQNKPNPGRGFAGDPANWDPAVDQQLQDQMWQKQQETIERINDLRAAQKAARDATGRARGAAGAGGFAQPAPQPAPSPQGNLPGCPPNCGNENLTVPKIQVQPSGLGEGQIEVGSAGVASSFYPFPWPK